MVQFAPLKSRQSFASSSAFALDSPKRGSSERDLFGYINDIVINVNGSMAPIIRIYTVRPLHQNG